VNSLSADREMEAFAADEFAPVLMRVAKQSA
jgi:hypothetical protein